MRIGTLATWGEVPSRHLPPSLRNNLARENEPPGVSMDRQHHGAVMASLVGSQDLWLAEGELDGARP